MDNFIVSARKYRPITFDSVVGQSHITNTLKNAIKNNQLAQAFLFCGPRGVGKTTCARILAKTINCQNLTPQFEACGVCDSCKSFQYGNSYNFHELDAASNNSVDDIRNLIEQVRIPPQGGKFKVYIIDEVHMLSSSAFNAFLKTLEEPPSYAIFILATTEKHKILPTILSRCQIFDFNRIRVEDMALHLEGIAIKEQISFDRDGIHLIAQKADGGLRDALSMFDQIASFSNKNISYQAVIDNLNLLDYDYYFKITDQLLNKDLASALLLFDEVLNNGFEALTFAAGFAVHIRNLLVCKDETTLVLLEVSNNIKLKYQQQAAKSSTSFLISALNISNQCEINYKQSKNPRLQIELMLVKLSHIEAALTLANQAPSYINEVKKKPENLGHKQNSSLEVKVSTNEIAVNETPLITTSGNLPIGKTTVVEEIKVGAEIKPKSLIKSIPSSHSLIPDLKNLTTPSNVLKEPDIEILEGIEQSDFSERELNEVWVAYILILKEKNRMALAALMDHYKPHLIENFVIELTLSNKLQEEELKNGKIELLNYLRTSLKNFAIQIQTIISAKEIKGRPYTAQEKYLYFVEKNPQIEVLKNTFNLNVL